MDQHKNEVKQLPLEVNETSKLQLSIISLYLQALMAHPLVVTMCNMCLLIVHDEGLLFD